MINYIYRIDTYDGKGLRTLNTKPLQANSDVRKLSEELDYGTMILVLKNKEPLPTMSYLQYEIDDGFDKITREFYIGNDEVQLLGKYKKYYQHSIELIELTKAMEKSAFGTICFTQPIEQGRTNYYLSDCIDRILRIADIVHDEKSNFYYYNSHQNPSIPLDCFIKNINKELFDYLKTIPSPQFVFNNPTLREALDGVLKYINSVSRLEKKLDFTYDMKRLYEFKNQTKVVVNIQHKDARLKIRLIPKKSNINFLVCWGNDKYSFYDIRESTEPIYLEQEEGKKYNDIGEYTIHLPSDFSYELVGDEINNNSCIEYINSNSEVKITDIKINGLKSIGKYAFYNCTELNNLYMQNGLEEIKDYAFYNIYKNSSLNENNINFPQTLTVLGEYAFYVSNPVNYLHLYFNGYNIPTLNQTSFNIDYIGIIRVLKGRYNDYKNNFEVISSSLSSKIELTILDNQVYPYILINGRQTTKRLHVRIVPKYTGKFNISWGDNNPEDEYDVVENTPIILQQTRAYSEVGEYRIEFYNEGEFYFEGLYDTSYEDTVDENGYLTNYKSAFWSYSDNVTLFDLRDSIDIIRFDFAKITKLGDYCFANLTQYGKWEELNLYQWDKDFEIGKYCFYNCLQINNIQIPYGIKNIEEGAFYNCYPIDLEIPASVVNIKKYAFYDSLYFGAYIPYSVVQIQEYAFMNSIESYTSYFFIPNSVLYIDNNSIEGIIFTDLYSKPYGWEDNWLTTHSKVFWLKTEGEIIKELSFESFANIKKLIENKNEYTYNSSFNVEDYSTNLISFAKNVIDEEKYDYIAHVSYPQNYDSKTLAWDSSDIFAKVMSEEKEYSVNDTNYGIVTNFPIQSVINVKIPIEFSTDPFGTNIADIFGLPRKLLLDISDFVVEQNLFYGLSEIERRGYFTYKKGQNFIHFGSSFDGVLFTYPALRYVLENALQKVILENSKYPDVLESRYFIKLINNQGEAISDELETHIHYRYKDVKVDITEFFYPDDINTLGYKLKYIPITDCIINAEKENTEDSYLKSTSIINQEERVISFSNFTNTLYSLSQRKGNKTKELSCQHFSVSDLINIGDYTEDGYVCTTAEYIYYNNYIIGKYTLDKNYNRISSFMGINADIRQYQIPINEDTYTRNINLNSYVEIGYIQNPSTSTNKNTYFPNLSSYISKTLGCYDENSKYLSKISYAVVTISDRYTDNQYIISHYNGKKPYFLLECIARGGKNLITFDFKFQNNYSAGMYTYYDVTDSKVLKNKIYYCIPDGIYKGFLRNLSFDLVSEFEWDNEKLPLFFKYYQNFENTAFSSNDLLILKDPAETLAFTYQLNFISKDNRIILGNAFCENNYMITGSRNGTIKPNMKVRLYQSPLQYSKFDTKQLKGKKQDNNLIDEWVGSSNEKDYILFDKFQDFQADFFIKFNKDSLQNKIMQDTRTIILADGYDNIIMHISYDPNDVDESGENYLYKPIYFNFKDRRSDIKYEY